MTDQATTATEGVNVAVYGPNLRRTAETFHIHDHRCGDRRRPLYNGHEAVVTRARTLVEIVTDIYPPADFEYDADDPDALAAYVGDFKVFPCVKGLA